jgi:cobalamin biosynthesis protein CobW
MKRVAANIVTGFLGSGKTTLLRSLLERGMDGERIALVVNEIGEIGIDGVVLHGLEHVEQMVELSNGCVCCSIDDAQFELAIEEVVRTSDPTLIVIETTGVADPSALVARVERAGLGLDAVITVVDAESAPRFLRLSRVASRQIRAADFLVVTKGDLVGDSGRDRMKAKLRRMNSRALVLESLRGDADLDTLFAPGVGRRRRRLATELSRVSGEAEQAPEGHTHLADDGVETFAECFDGAVDRSRLEAFLKGLPHGVWRAKGLVAIENNPWSCLFSYTCGRYELNWVKLTGPRVESQAVFIGRDLSPHRQGIIRDLRATRVDSARREAASGQVSEAGESSSAER